MPASVLARFVVSTLLLSSVIGLRKGNASPPEKHASRAIVIIPVSGPRGDHATTVLARALRRIRIIPFKKYQQVRRRKSSATAATRLNITAIVHSALARVHGRWSFRTTIKDAQDDVILATRILPLRGPRLDAGSARQIANAVIRAIGGRATRTSPKKKSSSRPERDHSRLKSQKKSKPQANHSAPPPRSDDSDDQENEQGDVIVDGIPVATEPRERTPEKAPHAPKNIGSIADIAADNFAVTPTDTTAQRSGVPRTRAHIGNRTGKVGPERSRPVSRTVPSEIAPNTHELVEKPIIEGALGLMAINRAFGFIDAKAEPPLFSTPSVMPALVIDAAVYPLAFFLKNPLADLGVGIRYGQVVATKTQLGGGADDILATTLRLFDLDFRFRWNILNARSSPLLTLSLGYGQQIFSLSRSVSKPTTLPNIAYTYFRPRLSLDWPFLSMGKTTFGATAQIEFLAVLSAGEIVSATRPGYGSASIFGLGFGGGLFGYYGGFFGRLEGFYRRYGLDFDRSCVRANTGCQEAVGAVDIYAGASLSIGYRYQ